MQCFSAERRTSCTVLTEKKLIFVRYSCSAEPAEQHFLDMMRLVLAHSNLPRKQGEFKGKEDSLKLNSHSDAKFKKIWKTREIQNKHFDFSSSIASESKIWISEKNNFLNILCVLYHCELKSKRRCGTVEMYTWHTAQQPLKTTKDMNNLMGKSLLCMR